MAAHRATKGGKAVGTLMIDRVFPAPVGRIRRASGTSNKTVLRAMQDAFTALVVHGRTELLVAMREGRLTPMQVYAAQRDSTLDALPTAEALELLVDRPAAAGVPARAGVWNAVWDAAAVATDDSRISKGYREQAAAALLRLKRAAERLGMDVDAIAVGDLPALLAEVRTFYADLGQRRAFNLTKSLAQSFVRRHTGKVSSPVYVALGDVAGLAIAQSNEGAGNPLTVAQFDRLVAALGSGEAAAGYEIRDAGAWAGRAAEAAAVATEMAHSGMHWSELLGEWKAHETHVRVEGTKRAARKRNVPRLLPVDAYVRPQLLSQSTFRQRLARASVGLFDEEGQRTPYDLRRTFATWMELAGIPESRRDQYMGHAPRGVRERYTRSQVLQWCAEDAQRLHDYLKRERAK